MDKEGAKGGANIGAPPMGAGHPAGGQPAPERGGAAAIQINALSEQSDNQSASLRMTGFLGDQPTAELLPAEGGTP